MDNDGNLIPNASTLIAIFNQLSDIMFKVNNNVENVTIILEGLEKCSKELTEIKAKQIVMENKLISIIEELTTYRFEGLSVTTQTTENETEISASDNQNFNSTENQLLHNIIMEENSFTYTYFSSVQQFNIFK